MESTLNHEIEEDLLTTSLHLATSDETLYASPNNARTLVRWHSLGHVFALFMSLFMSFGTRQRENKRRIIIFWLFFATIKQMEQVGTSSRIAVLSGHMTANIVRPLAGPARIAVIGAAWWSQGWHLPQLHRNPDAVIAAIMQRSEQPIAAAFLNLTLETKTQLRARYPDAPIYNSCEDMLADAEIMNNIDGVIICTAHACHFEMGSQFLGILPSFPISFFSFCSSLFSPVCQFLTHLSFFSAAGKHVLMEKPMTVDVYEALIMNLSS